MRSVCNVFETTDPLVSIGELSRFIEASRLQFSFCKRKSNFLYTRIYKPILLNSGRSILFYNN